MNWLYTTTILAALAAAFLMGRNWEAWEKPSPRYRVILEILTESTKGEWLPIVDVDAAVAAAYGRYINAGSNWSEDELMAIHGTVRLRVARIE